MTKKSRRRLSDAPKLPQRHVCFNRVIFPKGNECQRPGSELMKFEAIAFHSLTVAKKNICYAMFDILCVLVDSLINWNGFSLALLVYLHFNDSLMDSFLSRHNSTSQFCYNFHCAHRDKSFSGRDASLPTKREIVISFRASSPICSTHHSSKPWILS